MMKKVVLNGRYFFGGYLRLYDKNPVFFKGEKEKKDRT
jgi:hypothetical protein